MDNSGLNSSTKIYILRFGTPEKFSHKESHGKISNFIITDLFHSHILNINRGSLQTSSFRGIHLSVFTDTDQIKMALRARKVIGAFEKQTPELVALTLCTWPVIFFSYMGIERCRYCSPHHSLHPPHKNSFIAC